MSGERSALGVWWLAIRPATLTAALGPVMVGAAVAQASGGVRWGAVLAALAGAVCIQVGTNLANDVFDHEKGADTEARVGPLRVTQAGLLSPSAVRRGMVAAFALAALFGVYLAAVGGWPIVALGLASIASGVAYTGGPWPLGYHGLGDLFVFVFFGLVAVCGTVWVAHGALPALAWWAAVPVGSLCTAVLVVNNLRDRHTDAVAGKRTLVVRFGRAFGVAEYALAVVGAYAIPLSLVALGAVGWWGLLPWGSLPVALGLVRRVAQGEGASLNPLLGATARLLLVFSALFSLGLVLGAR